MGMTGAGEPRWKRERDGAEGVGVLILFVLDCVWPRDSYVSQDALWRSVNLEMGYAQGQEKKFPVSKRQIRHGVRELRRAGHMVISKGGVRGGYKMAQSLDEVHTFVSTELRSKALDMLTTSSKMMKSARAKFGGQTFWTLQEEQRVDELLGLQMEIERLSQMIEGKGGTLNSQIS